MQTTNPRPPPKSENELLTRANKIAGKTIQDLADAFSLDVPKDFRRAKGWLGQLIELHLGASAASRPEPDFTLIGVELKTIPINKQLKPKETTYVCTTELLNLSQQTWKTSNVYKKLARVLWVPNEADPDIPIAQRKIGQAILWSPDEKQEAALQSDWEELSDMITMGQLESISAKHGQFLHIRPKAANSKALTWGISESGDKIQTLPRGFYLRTSFTSDILKG